MNAQTRQHLEDLKKVGFDVSSLEQQMNSSPVLDKAGDNIIGGGILRQSDYTRYLTKANEEKAKLEKQVQELAARHDSVDALQGDETLYNAALQVIADQEKALIDAGYDEEEVKKLSFANKEKLTTVPEKKTEPNKPVVETKKEENTNVTRDPNKTYIDAETFQAQQANLIYGNVAMTARVQGAFDRARELGIKVAPEVANNLAESMRKGIEAGKNIDQIFDEQFGFSVAEKAKQDADVEARIKAAREEGLAEGRKSEPARRMVSREKHPVFDNVAPVVIPDTRKPREELLKDLPRNKFGDVEYFQLRGDTDSRVARAAASFEDKFTTANAE